MKIEEKPNDHYIEDLTEWQENQYNPGYYLGGKIPGNLLYHGRPRLVGIFLIIIGLLLLFPFVLGAVSLFRSGFSLNADMSPLQYVQLLAIGILSLIFIINGMRKLFCRKQPKS